MKLKKGLLTLFLVLTLILSLCTNVYAENESAVVTLSEDSSSAFKVGGTVKINVDISVSGFDGVFEFLADLRYDKDVLKYTGVTTADGWRVNRDDVYIERADQVDTKGRLCTLNFEVLKAEETTIKLLHTDTSGNSGAVLYLSKNVNEPSITIKPQQEPENPAPENPTPENPTPENPTPENPAPENPEPENPTPEKPDTPTTPDTTKKPDAGNNKTDNSNKTNNTNKTTTTNKKQDTAPTKIPQTGSLYIEVIVIAAMVLVVVFVGIKYVEYSKILKK